MQLPRMLVEPALHFVLLFLVVGCGARRGNSGGDLAPDALGAAALETHSRHVKKCGATETPPAREIAESCWAKEIAALRPLRVYLHRTNLVVVQRESGEMEEGKYIYILISSYLPQSGDDGFTFTNQDGCVSDFRRVKR